MDASAATAWPLGSTEPAVAYLTRRDVLGEPVPHPGAEVLRGPTVRHRRLCRGRRPRSPRGAAEARRALAGERLVVVTAGCRAA